MPVERKHIKPRSLTFWASLTPIVLGVFVAFEPLHGASEWVHAVNAMTGGASPYALINAGLVGIGLRGAIG